ncbi:helix-turn-helix domain-containing protein [Chryseolinea lacunae]|uniref:Helix-turn-helix transcriptional regulator n=1 Tax=Chryseolinea lacunae TaxID=2801331 RepID=A0ABS1L0H4_9BACT|nr:helix-turn-helix transcriptional regulator [Chryseolinea lacunae]MBL0744412.1 helix-turn-helix transcriptional regulator [Chryseolinea lacunae]
MTTQPDQPARARHLGQNVRRFRERNKLKQEDLAALLGDPWTQKKISQLEARETIDPDVLAEVAKALNVSADEIKSYSEETVFYNIQNNYEGSNNQGPNIENYHCTFNPLDKLIEAHDEIKKLNAALLKEKDEKIALLERILGEKK